MNIPDMSQWIRPINFQCHEKAFDPFDEEISEAVEDIVRGKRLCEKIGMGYEFFARQLPMPKLKPALTAAEARTQLGLEVEHEGMFFHGGTKYFCVNVGIERHVVPAPEIWAICTCPDPPKSEINPRYDLVRYGLKNGHVILETPCDGNMGADSEPPADALIVMAHALANTIIASVLGRWEPGSPFFHRLKNRGMGILHWYGFLSERDVPFGHFVHHDSSASQSAVAILQGKLKLLNEGAKKALYHQGDIYINRQHGTTINCASLEIFLHCL